jgi:hypothetical protein
MSNKEELDERVETDLEELLDTLLDSDNLEDRAEALAKLEVLGPDMSQSDLSLSTAVLKKANAKEEVEKLKVFVNKLLNHFWKHKKVLEFDGLEKPMSMEQIRQKVATDKLESYAGPVGDEDHLANLRALPVIEEHLYWIALWAKITIAMFVLTVVIWFVFVYLLALISI